MNRNWKETEFVKKLKEFRISRATYLSLSLILLSLALVLAVTAVANRTKKNRVDNLPATENTTATVTEKKVEPATEKKEPEKDAVETVPELALPVSGRLSKNHSVDVQVFSQTMKDYRVHLGVDIATAADAPVCAAADGVVSQVWEDPMMGWCVALSHAADCVTVYKNLSSELAEGLNIGTQIQRGQLIGYVGNSAIMEIAEDPHLHMEMTVNGLQVNPLDYFSAAVVKTLTEVEVFEDEGND